MEKTGSKSQGLDSGVSGEAPGVVGTSVEVGAKLEEGGRVPANTKVSVPSGGVLNQAQGGNDQRKVSRNYGRKEGRI